MNINIIKTLSKLVIVIILIVTVSCEKNEETNIKDSQPIDKLDILEIHDILFNIPIIHDTILLDKNNNIDFRIEVEGYKIDSTILIIDKSFIIKRGKFIISTNSLYLSEGLHTISFLIHCINSENGDTVIYKTYRENLKVIENLSNRYINEAIINGNLQLTWPELDKRNTNMYLIERYMGENMEYSQDFEVQDPIYLDSYYVGEEVNLRISVINNEGGKQNIWYYKKLPEKPVVTISQNQSGGYDIHFSKSKYKNSFGQYYVTTGLNYNPEFIFSSTNIEDTVYSISDAKFADEGQFWLRYLPKEYPQGVSDEDWMLYSKYIYTRYGDKNFEYETIAIINNENFAFTSSGNIYKYNIRLNQKTDSIINENAKYGLLRTTPAGNYLYAIDENINGSPVYFWTANSLSTNPNYTFQNDFIVPPVSDNLLAIMSVPSNVTPSKLALYDVTNESIIYTTDYNGTSNRPTISSNGHYFFIDDSGLKLCSYGNNSFKLIWNESDWTKYYRFYDFSPQNNDRCYIWDDNKKFSIRSTSDFSELNSFPLELEEIINIDYYSKKIMGYATDKILVYNLDDGTLEKDIPANLSELFFYSNNAVLIGNTIFSNHGVKYSINP